MTAVHLNHEGPPDRYCQRFLGLADLRRGAWSDDSIGLYLHEQHSALGNRARATTNSPSGYHRPSRSMRFRINRISTACRSMLRHYTFDIHSPFWPTSRSGREGGEVAFHVCFGPLIGGILLSRQHPSASKIGQSLVNVKLR